MDYERLSQCAPGLSFRADFRVKDTKNTLFGAWDGPSNGLLISFSLKSAVWSETEYRKLLFRV